MDAALQQSVLAAWRLIPNEDRDTPATEEQLQWFAASFGPIPDDYRWFLSACGGGPCGGEWIDGIEELPETHRKFKEEFGPGGWSLADVFVIGCDGAGNPFGIHEPSGRVLVEDHDFGGIHEMAASFSAFLVKGLEIES